MFLNFSLAVPAGRSGRGGAAVCVLAGRQGSGNGERRGCSRSRHRHQDPSGRVRLAKQRSAYPDSG